MDETDIISRAEDAKKLLGQLYRFSARSAQDNKNKHLWTIGADLFISQINTNTYYYY